MKPVAIAAVVVLCGLFAAASCRFRNEAPAHLQAAKTLPATVLADPAQVTFYPNTTAAREKIINIFASSCTDSKPVAEITLKTPFGNTQVRLEEAAPPEQFAQLLKVTIDGANPFTIRGRPGLIEFGAQACEAHQQFGSKAVAAAKPEQIELIRDWLQAVAPDCDELVPVAEGWNCKMRMENANLIREELAGVRSTMISRWTRSPYLLARRIAVAMHLADALLAPNFEAELARQCRIIRNSLDIELPTTISSQTWQRAACEGGPLDSVRAAVNIGLTKSMAEIDLLRQLFERSNRQGYLSVRIPDGPGGSLWVTLYPSDQTSSVLVAEAQALYLEKIGGPPPEQSTNAPKACWHPIYGENSAILTLARHLDLAGDTAKAFCEDLALPAEQQPERYLAESIASESEFVVNNGRAKMLRLPKGRYSYRLQVLPKDPNDWDNAASSVPESTGEFDWTEARPRPQITHW